MLFGIKGLSGEVLAAVSTRSAEIEAALAERGTSRDMASASEKQVAALDTREAKVAADHTSLVADWRETASAAGLGPEVLLAMISPAAAQAAAPHHPASLDMQSESAPARAVPPAHHTPDRTPHGED